MYLSKENLSHDLWYHYNALSIYGLNITMTDSFLKFDYYWLLIFQCLCWWFDFLSNVCTSFNLPGTLWCPVVTWEYLIQQKYTIEGSWSRTWKKPWSNSASTSSVSSCIFTGEFMVLLALPRCHACFWWVRYYCSLRFYLDIAELWGLCEFLVTYVGFFYVMSLNQHSVWPVVVAPCY